MRIAPLMLGGIAVSFLAGVAFAQPAGPPGSATWRWPLYETRIENNVPVPTFARPAVWTSHGEFQDFGDGRSDPHPGIDIRGDEGDVVLFPVPGTVVQVSRRHQCAGFNTGVQCRIWVKTPDADVNTNNSSDYIYYLGHFDFGHTPNSPVLQELREKLVLAEDGSVLQASGPPAQALAVQTGEVAGQLVNWGDNVWHHLHVGVFDPNDKYASVDPLWFFDRHAVGNDGALEVLDDESPKVKNMSLVTDPSITLSVPNLVNPAGLCGLEVRGAIDIKADIRDTFFSTQPVPNAFDGSTTFLPTIGISGAQYTVLNLGNGEQVSRQWLQSPLTCTGAPKPGSAPGDACGLWRMRIPQSIQSSFNNFNTDLDFFNWLRSTSHNTAEFVGGDFSDQLYSLTESSNDHTDSLDHPFIHILTNSITEASPVGSNDAWRTTDFADGRYAVTVEAWDVAGNLAQQTLLVTVNNGGLTVAPGSRGYGEILVKDHPNDIGQIPSDRGGEPFWVSDDIVVVDRGVTATPSTPARSEPLVVGEDYDVFVIVHNSGCVDVSGVQAAVYSATPGPTMTDVLSISNAPGADPLVYDGTAVNVPAGGAAVIGPFPWTPTVAELGSTVEGHRCLLAAINAPTDPGPSLANPATFAARDSDLITQRNVQVSLLEFFIKNVDGAAHSSKLEVDLGTFPLNISGAYFELVIQDTDGLFGLWSGTPNTTVTQEAGNVVVRFLAGKTTLPAWTLPAVSERFVSVRFGGLPDGSGPYLIAVRHLLDDAAVGGMTLSVSGPPEVR
jgi:hypothetical protein